MSTEDICRQQRQKHKLNIYNTSTNLQNWKCYNSFVNAFILSCTTFCSSVITLRVTHIPSTATVLNKSIRKMIEQQTSKCSNSLVHAIDPPINTEMKVAACSDEIPSHFVMYFLLHFTTISLDMYYYINCLYWYIINVLERILQQQTSNFLFKRNTFTSSEVYTVRVYVVSVSRYQ